MKDERGVTLIEMLVVLAIVTLTLRLPVIQVGQMQKSVQEEWFFNELDSRFQTMQMLAIVSGSPSTIATLPNHRQFQFNNYSVSAEHPLNQYMILPEHVSFIGTNSQGFYFKGHTGNVSSAMTIRLLVNERRRDLTIQLGSGRYLLSPVPSQ